MTNTIYSMADATVPSAHAEACANGAWLGRDYANALRGPHDVTADVAWQMALECDGVCGLARKVGQLARKSGWDAYCERAALWAAREAYVARMTGEG